MTFFSGTDQSELLTNVKNLPIYLSLIVNYRCDPCAKIAIVADAEETQVNFLRYILRGSNGKKKSKKYTTTKSTPAYIIECDVNFEQDAWFVKELLEVKEKSKPKPYISTYSGNQSKSLGFEHDPKGAWDKYYNKDGHGTSEGGRLKSKTSAYTKVVNRVQELLTLGECEGISAYAALMLVDPTVGHNMREKYKSALKSYFLDTWFDKTFVNDKSLTPEDALVAILEFMAYHKSLWIYKVIEEFVNELKDELTALQSV